MQWIVPHAGGGFAVLFCPVWTEAMAAVPGASDGSEGERTVRRRSAPLSSRWLPHAIALAEDADTPRIEGPPIDVGPRLHFSFATAERGPAVSLMRDDDVAFASLFAEMVRVVADLCESASLPVLALAPDPTRRGLDVVLGSLVLLPAQTAFDALCVLHVAVDMCAQQRGFLVADATVAVARADRAGGADVAPLDARAAALFSRRRT